ncbi:MAG TPA: hypothetical protein VFG55_06705 [Rhodanobacteraceae bacterium]|nr:hypothetical protein [Rhodanobacteraceae bacterium]
MRDTLTKAAEGLGPVRYLVFGVAMIACVAGLLLWCARVEWSDPLVAHERIAFGGDDFSERLGSAFGLDGRLQISALGAEGAAMQTRRIPPIRARDHPVLRYRFAAFPDTLELTFVFRRTDSADDVETVTLPRPGGNIASFDLGRVPAWRGEISEIGFAEYPTAQLVPRSVGPAPFSLEHAELWSPSWRGGLAALMLDWFGYRPWGLFSVSSVSMEAGPHSPRAPALVLALSLALTAFALLGWLLLGWRRRRLARRIGIALAAAWLLLDIHQIGELGERLQTTRTVYAGRTWEERAHLVPDQSLQAAAERVREAMGAAESRVHVLVWAGSPFQTGRLYYHLLPLNVGLLADAIDASVGRDLPPRTLIAVYDSDWTYDAATRRLSRPGAALTAEPVMRDGPLGLYRTPGSPL